MCSAFEITEKTVREFISKEEPFTYEYLCEVIMERGGVGRIVPGLTLSQFIDEFVEDGIIYYDAYSHIYRFTREIEEIIQRQLDAVVLD